MDLSADGRLVAAAGQGRRVFVWQLANGREVFPPGVHTDSITALRYSPNGRLLVSADAVGNVVARDGASGEIRYRLADLKRFVYGLEFSPDGKQLVVFTVVGLKLFDGRSGKPRSAPWADKKYAALRFSPDGRQLAASTQWPVVDLLDPKTGAVIRQLGRPQSGDRIRQNLMAPTSVSFSPDSRFLATARWDEDVRIWDVNSGALGQSLDGLLHVAYGPDGRQLATGTGTVSKRNTKVQLRLFELPSGSTRCNFDTDGPPRFSPLGRVIAAVTKGEVVFWDTRHCRVIGRTGTRHHVRVMAFAPDGKHLATGGRKGDVIRWRLKRGD